MVVLVLPHICLWEAELVILGFALFIVLLRHIYKFLKSEWRENPEQQSPKTFNLTVKTTKTRVEKAVSFSLGPRLLTVPSIMPDEEKVEFADAIGCPTCGAAIPVARMVARIIARYTCPRCGNDVLIEPKPNA